MHQKPIISDHNSDNNKPENFFCFSLKSILLWFSITAVCFFLVMYVHSSSVVVGPLVLATKGKVNTTFGRILGLMILLPTVTLILILPKKFAKYILLLGGIVWLLLGYLFTYCVDW